MALIYQCLQTCGDVLIAASGSRLDSFSTKDGSLLSSWTAEHGQNGSGAPVEADHKQDVVVNVDQSAEGVDSQSSRPAKRRRLSNDAEDKQTANGAPQATASPASNPRFSALAATSDGRHVIAVTMGDKTIRVFEHDGQGRLGCLSQRVMPKRPSAITITADNETILSADKFGDVFSLPLLVTQRPRNGVTEEKGAQSTPPTGRSAKPAAPAANDLTVHTLRNRKALEHQLRGDQTAPSRAEPDFELKLLFGHVSMLTDVTAVERNGRGYIISADRDEHIRVSRGEPQAHIIEGFCLGHRSFISKLCVPVTASHILLSGGGDDEIFVWNWLTGIVLQKVSLRHDVEAVMADTVLPTPHASDSTGTAPSLQHAIAVANIQHVARTSNQPSDTIIVTCEGCPALFVYSLGEDSSVAHTQTLRLDGNPIGMAVDHSSGRIIVSVDCAHLSGSKTTLRSEGQAELQPLLLVERGETEWSVGSLEFSIGSGTTRDSHVTVPADLIYPLEYLRKRGDEE